MKILRVAVPTILRQTFDYLLPETFEKRSLQPGMRIKIPFGSREVVGLVLSTVKKTKVSVDKLKPVLSIVDEKPILSASLLTLLQWTADYYHHPIGEVMLGSLPALMRQGRHTLTQDMLNTLVTIGQTNPTSGLKLTQAQQQALEKILNVKNFQPFLLEGVTGSGKTEVYLQAIEAQLKANKSALILVPEISLTPQTVERFQNRFTVPIAVLHSGLTNKERFQAWNLAQSGLAKVIIGTRSAIFTPIPNLGIIILDEAHDPSFKQQSGLRYSARDVGIKRAQLENIPIVLGSATPSLESLCNVARKRFTHLSLPTRVGSAVSPKFYLIDLRGQYLKEGLSRDFLRAVREHLEKQGQVLLFLNRRGYAPILLCHYCGYSVNCLRCEVPLTLHLAPKNLICHHCGARQNIPSVCPECQQAKLLQVGLGTERLEEILKKEFPETSLVRIDRDSTRKKGALNTMLSDIHSGEKRILLGTQMLAKGHHFPEVTMVGIIDGDSGLYSTDFRATERMAQLIMQVAGRAGRAKRAGEVYIQTHNPEHPLLQRLLANGYVSFAKALLSEREAAKLPPFGFLALVRAEAVKAHLPMRFLEEARSSAGNIVDKLELLGPIPAPMQKRAGKYRAQLLLRANNRTHLQNCLSCWIPKLTALKSARQVRWSIDVDPQEMG